MPNSVMPKGVEHTDPIRQPEPRGNRVPNSVMPKGVEHASASLGFDSPDWVPNSVMPKGVEHYIAVCQSGNGYYCAEFSDAERR